LQRRGVSHIRSAKETPREGGQVQKRRSEGQPEYYVPHAYFIAKPKVMEQL